MAKEGITVDLEESKNSANGSGGDGTEGHHLHQDLQAADGAALDEGDRGFWPVLQNRQFLILWAGQIFSQLADKVFLVMAIALIASRFQLSDQPISGWVSSVMIAFTIPAVL
ncbi:MAG: arabinose efflux permease, partial [Cyanobacteria bacterium P01_F01_bin.153]